MNLKKVNDWIFKISTGQKVIKDFGVFSRGKSTSGMGYYRELALLKVKDNKGEHYVIEKTGKNKIFPGSNIQRFEITSEELRNLQQLLNKILD